jgi:hypothetical protein
VRSVWHDHGDSHLAQLIGGVLVVVVGAGVCLANDYYWQSKIPPTQGLPGYPPLHVAGEGGSFGMVSGDLLLVALPFYVLGVLVAFRATNMLASVLAFVALLVITIFEYRWANLTQTSTAGLAFVGALQVGLPICAAAWAASALWRRRTARAVP